MRPKKPAKTVYDDLFLVRLDHLIKMRNELVQSAGRIYWDWIYDEWTPHFSGLRGPAEPVRFMIG